MIILFILMTKNCWKYIRKVNGEKGMPEEEGKQPSMPRRRKKKQENRKKAYQKRNKQEKRYVNLNKILIQFTIF